MGFDLGSFGGSILGVAGDLYGAHKQNKWNVEAAQKGMDFSERMSSTAHQRQVADMRAAGLNPILSAGGGADSPGGMGFSAPNMSSIGSSFASSARDSKRVSQEVRESGSRIEVQGAQKAMAEAGAEAQKASARNMNADFFKKNMENEFLQKNPNWIGIQKFMEAFGGGLGMIRDAAGTYRSLKGFGNVKDVYHHLED